MAGENSDKISRETDIDHVMLSIFVQISLLLLVKGTHEYR